MLVFVALSDVRGHRNFAIKKEKAEIETFVKKVSIKASNSIVVNFQPFVNTLTKTRRIS